MQDEIMKKKEYLKCYEKAVRQMESAELKMQEIRLSKILSPVVNDGMPHAHNNGDLSSYAVLLERAKSEYIKCRYYKIKKYKEVSEKIQELSREDEKMVLIHRYINLLKWHDIQEKMNMKERQVYRLHMRALKNLKI